MALITRPNTYVSGAVILASEVNDNETTIYNEFNGNISNANIVAAAGIVGSKLTLNTFANALPQTTLVKAGGSASTTFAPGGLLSIQSTAVGTDAATTEKTLHTYTMEANALDANNDVLRVRAWGSFAANANNKIVRLYLGTEAPISFNSTPNGREWMIDYTILRTGASAGVAFGRFEHLDNGAAGATMEGRFQNTTVTQSFAGAIIIKVTGQNGTATANDIISKGMLVMLDN